MMKRNSDILGLWKAPSFKKSMALLLLFGLVAARPASAGQASDPLKNCDKYNVVWDSPSKDAWGTMPLGNGDISLNVWVEESGDLVFYIGKTDSWDDNSRLLKVGRLRFRFAPNPYPDAPSFRQTLRLRDAAIEIVYGEGKASLRVLVWVDANNPVIHVEAEGAQQLEATAAIELWRTRPEELPKIEVSDVSFDHDVPDNKHFPLVVEPDTLLAGQPDRIGWYHHNKKSVGPEISAKLQDMVAFQQPDPIFHRTFGAVVIAQAGKKTDDTHLLSPRAKSHRFDIYVLTQHPALPDEWLTAMDQLIADSRKTSYGKLRDRHASWWEDFWNRSWIDIASADAPDAAAAVARGYILQRFINACAGRGAYPIKFNGSIFTVPNPGSPGGADYRAWGPGYWWQNTRLPYEGMCASGDFDLMQPLFRMYAGDILEMAKYRTQHYFGHAGAFLNECVMFWGAAFNESYGWAPPEKRDVKINESRWHRWEWQGGLELIQLMLDYYEHTQDTDFLSRTLLPFSREILTFYDVHYPVDDKGKIVMQPAQALETWWECRNPMPEVAGILSVTERLKDAAGDIAGANVQALWRRLHDKMPGLPTRELNGKRMLAAAEKFAAKNNVENPELYAVFPYRRIAVGRPDLALGIEALHNREDRGHAGWRQDEIFMAYLGLADEARENLVARANEKNKDSRFPAFWGPNYDWIPDQDHGSNLIKTLQSMLMQTDGRTIYLLPAWPSNWDTYFRLQAPYKTTVEAQIKQGKVVRLKVSPSSRAKDVKVGPNFGS